VREPYRVEVNERDRLHADLVMQLVAVRLGVSTETIRRTRRLTVPALRARRVAIYLTHVALGWQLERVGHAFGIHRQTAANAASRIEEARDHEALNQLLEELEDAIHAVVDAPPPNLSDLGEVA
jgi:chromosomal replication initiation ATPase DnaA